jgi:hypothetical protein
LYPGVVDALRGIARRCSTWGAASACWRTRCARLASTLPYRGVDNDAAKIAQARSAARARDCATSRST